ncbi:MAG: TolC family protein [Flavobacteriales bacterium]|nr:TolC family protein [Flavobacteriales bacterium]
MKTIKYIFLFCIILVFRFEPLNAQSLDSLLQLVVENNTQLKSIELEYESVMEKKNQVNQLPNPQLGVGVPALRPETRLGPQMMMVSASQIFPWFGTLKSKEEVVISMSKAKYEQIAIVKLDLFYQVKSAYYQLYFLDQKQSVLRSNIKLYESLEAISLANVESGQATLSDVLRVQTKLQSLRQQLLMIDNQKFVFESKINELTKQPTSIKIELVDSLVLPVLEYDLASFKNKIENNHPLITQVNYQIEQSNNSIAVNTNMNKPTLGLGLDYSFVGQRTDANPMNNGRDILVPKVMLSIPIYRKSYQAKIEEEKLIQQSLEVKKETITDKMISLLINYKADYDNGLLEISLYQNQTNTMQMAYDVLLSEYSSSGKGFEELLMVQNQLLDFDLGIYKAELKANIAQANIERITKF